MMKPSAWTLLGVTFFVAAYALAESSTRSPAEDRDAFRRLYERNFPEVPLSEHKNGIYALDSEQRAQWEAIEDFPPYELAVDEGKELFETPFANGKRYADCFDNGGIGIRQNYPYFDTDAGTVITLEYAINQCREANGEEPLKYSKGDIAAISAYMAYTSRGNVFDVQVPDDPRAMAAYQDGKQFYFSKRGQLNFSCADCHAGNAGRYVRADRLSATLGHPTHFPVYRSKWGELGTLHRRFTACNRNIRATPLGAQSEAYRNLEYFLSYLSNGLEINGPGARK